MLPSFDDITSRINMPPVWYDEHGTPRYDEFNPKDLGIYDDFAGLFEIECQDCGERFFVGHGWNKMNLLQNHWIRLGLWATREESSFRREGDDIKPEYTQPTLEDLVSHYHYGDPPRHGCVGDTMNCNDIRVVEAWHKPFLKEGIEEREDGMYPGGSVDMTWHRINELEKSIEQNW